MSDKNEIQLTASIDEETYELVAEAASLLNMPLIDFVSAAVIEKAEAFHREGVRIQIDWDTADRMLQALDAPAEPNEYLQEAIITRSVPCCGLRRMRFRR